MVRQRSVPRSGESLFKHPLAAATMAVIHQRGYEQASVAEFCARAGISESELPPGFHNKHVLTLAVSEAYVEDFKARVSATFLTGGRWPDSLRAAAYETLRWLGRHPEAVWWGMVGAVEAGEVARARRDGVFAWAAELIDAGREVAPDPEAVPPGAALMAVGAVAEALGRRAQGTIFDDPVAAVPRMMYGAVLPYLGEEAARHELEIPPPDDLASGIRLDLRRDLRRHPF